MRWRSSARPRPNSNATCGCGPSRTASGTAPSTAVRASPTRTSRRPGGSTCPRPGRARSASRSTGRPPQERAKAPPPPRDLVDNFHKTGITIVMIDSAANLPDVIKTYARPFEIHTRRQELQLIIRPHSSGSTARSPSRSASHSGARHIVRNLRGLTRRQAVRVISDAWLSTRPSTTTTSTSSSQQAAHDPARRPARIHPDAADLDEIAA